MTITNNELGGLGTKLKKVLTHLFDTWLPSATMTFTNKTLGATTFTGAITNNVLQSASYGAGALSTAFAPRQYVRTENGHIITEIHVDLTALGCKGDAADDVIGLPAGGAAYLMQYVAATHGIVYRVEMHCIEAPGQGTATITSHIALTANASGTLAYDGAGGTAQVIDPGGAIAAGKTYVADTPALTTAHYLYLTEGDTAATTGVYNAGQLIIRLFGHPVIT